MVTRAVLRYIRVSPRKFRLIVPLIKGKRAEEAQAILASVKKGASIYAIELLKSALANAKRIHGIDTANLYISRLVVDGGPQLKRFRAASMGRASSIRKRTSHVTLELDEIKTHGTSHPSASLRAGRSQSKYEAKPKQHAVKSDARHAEARRPKIKAQSAKKMDKGH